MGNYKRVVYPTDKPAVLLDGGLNTKYEKSIINDNESPSCLNVEFSDGAVGTRQGTSKLNNTAIGAWAGDGLYTRHDRNGNSTMVAFAGGSAWELATATFATIGSAQSVFSLGVRVGAAEYQNHLFIGNGTVTPYKYNGTDFTRHGVPAPTATHSVATAGTGSALTGEYQYKVAYINSQSVIGDVGPANATFTAASENIALSSLPTAPQSHGVAGRRIFRTEAGGSTFKRLVDINDNTTTTYEDAIADGSLGANAPTDNGEPPNYSVIIYHADRLFMNDPSNPSYVWYSDITEPYTVQSTNFFTMGDNTRDLVVGFGILGEHLAVFCRESVFIIYMPDASDTNWEVFRTKSPYGTRSPFGIVNINNKLLFPAIQENKLIGIAALSGANLAPSATFNTISTAGSDLQSNSIEPDILEIQDGANLADISAFVYQNKAYFAVTYGSGATRNNRIYVYDVSIDNVSKKQSFSWTPWDGLEPFQFTEYSDDLYYITSNLTGFVYQMFDGTYTDDGNAIDSYFWTKEFGGIKGDFNIHKDFRYINLLVDMAGAYSMNLTYRVDSDKNQGTTDTLSLDPGGSLWGTMVWGEDVWGGGKNQEELRYDLGTLSGKRVQFMFSNQNTAGQRFKVHRINFLYNSKGLR